MRAGGEGATEDEIVEWHHQLNGHEFEQALRVGEGPTPLKGSLACCRPWDCKELDTNEQLDNNTITKQYIYIYKLKTK